MFDGREDADRIVVLAHGAGAPMDSPFMAAIAAGLAGTGRSVARFEFPYMAARRADGRRRPPDRQARLLETWRTVVQRIGAPRCVIGGKSMGGRMASLIADELGVAGLVCLGYPFHPPGKPERTRTAHLGDLSTPCLIVQGTRDPLGTREDVAGYALAPAIRLHWIEDGDHSLEPRKRSGRTRDETWAETVTALAAFLDELDTRS